MKINGGEYDFSKISISEILEKFKVDRNKVVVEVDREIISKADYDSVILDGREEVEIVAFIGGG